LFHSHYTGTYKLYPAREGKIACTHCGLNGPHVFSSKDYYYQIPVGNRTLYAGSFEYLIFLRNYFKENYRYVSGKEPTLDFPRLFYVRRDEIVKKIDGILKREMGCR
jgi:hypothetical protein